MVKILREKEKVDMVICLSHSGIKEKNLFQKMIDWPRKCQESI